MTSLNKLKSKKLKRLLKQLAVKKFDTSFVLFKLIPEVELEVVDFIFENNIDKLIRDYYNSNINNNEIVALFYFNLDYKPIIGNCSIGYESDKVKNKNVIDYQLPAFITKAYFKET